jgi:hypothetical protein
MRSTTRSKFLAWDWLSVVQMHRDLGHFPAHVQGLGLVQGLGDIAILATFPPIFNAPHPTHKLSLTSPPGDPRINMVAVTGAKP